MTSEMQRLAARIMLKMEKDGTMTTKNNQPKSQVTLDDLRKLGFSDKSADIPRRVIASLSGKDKTAKTHDALTAPGPIFFFNIDIGTEGVVEKFQNSGKQIFVYDIKFLKGMPQDAYKTMYADFVDRVDKVYKYNEGTLIMDTATEAFELARLAHFGKLTQVMPHHYTEVNAEWRRLLRIAYDSRMSTILINKVKAEYINDKRTGKYETAGFGDTAYLVQMNLTSSRDVDADGATRFNLTIDNCRQNPGLGGMVLRGMPVQNTSSGELVVDPVVNFEFLLSLIHDS